MTSKLNSRKFFLACASLVILTAALFFGKIAGGEFITGLGMSLGFYYGANVMQKKFLGESTK